jgi:hypothetical protein
MLLVVKNANRDPTPSIFCNELLLGSKYAEILFIPISFCLDFNY